MSKHTPGPWEFDEEMGEITTVTRIKNSMVEIAIVDVDNWDEPFGSEQKANARLIAAAPDLLEACLKTVEENRHLADGDNCTLIHLVRAIAKATGEANP